MRKQRDIERIEGQKVVELGGPKGDKGRRADRGRRRDRDHTGNTGP